MRSPDCSWRGESDILKTRRPVLGEPRKKIKSHESCTASCSPLKLIVPAKEGGWGHSASDPPSRLPISPFLQCCFDSIFTFSPASYPIFVARAGFGNTLSSLAMPIFWLITLFYDRQRARREARRLESEWEFRAQARAHERELAQAQHSNQVAVQNLERNTREPPQANSLTAIVASFTPAQSSSQAQANNSKTELLSKRHKSVEDSSEK